MKTSKQDIRQAALALFADRGYEAVSVRDIAEVLSLSKGALYRHFADKRAILDAILENADFTASLPTPHDAAALADFGKNSFARLTGGDSAALFRLLTVGQYGDEVLQYAYDKYLWQQPLEKIAPAFFTLPVSRREEAALTFWSPLLVLAGRYSRAVDKASLLQAAAEHCRTAAARLTRTAEERQTTLLAAAALGRRKRFSNRNSKF